MAREEYERNERERPRERPRHRHQKHTVESHSTEQYFSRRDRDDSRSRRREDYNHGRRSQERRHHSYSRSRSPRRRRHVSKSPNSKHRSRRRDEKYRTRSRSRSREARRPGKPLPSQQDAFNDQDAVVRKSPVAEKEKPNFGNTGKLAAASNTITTVDGQAIVLKYHEPAEARKPPAKEAWRMYVFKDSDVLDTVELAQRSCWLFGREHAVTDFPIDHPSCSKQHAVIQFRYIEKKTEFGDRIGKVKPFMIDLESANGTEVNGEAIPPGRYFELRDKDVVKFGLRFAFSFLWSHVSITEV